MFYVIGLGLGDATDVTVKGLEIIKRCERVFLESYTSILTVGADALEKFYGRPVIVADRELVETGADEILRDAETSDIGFLVIGDPFGATTHTDLVLRAREKNIPVQIVHNASIINAIGCCGLQLYSFGETISIPYWTNTWQPDSFYERIAGNRSRDLHTLCLLDIKVKEPTPESLMKRKKEYMDPKFMSVREASDQLIQVLDKRKQEGKELAFTEDSLVVGLSRVGSPDQRIIVCPLSEMRSTDLGAPLHCLVIPGVHLHPLEAEYLVQFSSNPEEFSKSLNL
ncbi:diphthine synthase [Fopius arisanus]|uniref:diphthine methyl ester synthase n=1 Tax=Fopius arisanus TaxID=64838 RepID=A0A9R1U492_9HYME|nr:PREDICTED: diphthine synthase [Fopius arisanus]